MALSTEVSLGPAGHIVLDGDPAPLPKKGTEPPIFGPCVLRPYGWMDQDAAWYEGRPRPRRLCVRWEPSSPPQKGGGAPPQFSSHVYCGQTAGWIKMSLGTEMGLGPGHIMLDGDPAAVSPPPIFGPFLLWPNGCMHQVATWYGGRPQSRRLYVRRNPAPYPKRGGAHPILGPRLLWPNGCMDQDATWYGGIGLGLRVIVLDGHPAPPPQKGHSSPIFGQIPLWPNGRID